MRRILAVSALLTLGAPSLACGPAPPPSAGATAEAAPSPEPPSGGRASGSDEEHEHEAPHKGSLIELGEEFAHVELVFDSASGLLTAYILDGEAEQPIRLSTSTLTVGITAPGATPVSVSLAAVANALTGETVGDSSQFQARVPALTGISTFAGVLPSLTVKGQAFTDVAFTFPAEH